MVLIELIYSLGALVVRKAARPIAFAMRKGVNMHPGLQRCIAQIAEKNQKEEKEVIEKAAQHLVVYTMAGSALVYYQTRPSPYQEFYERIEKIRQDWELIEKNRQEWEELEKKLNEYELVREQKE